MSMISSSTRYDVDDRLRIVIDIMINIQVTTCYNSLRIISVLYLSLLYDVDD